MLTGGAFRVSVPVAAADFALISGEVAIYTKIADSGARRRHAFCPVCGTPVYATADTAEPEQYSLRVGCLEQKALLAPMTQTWCGSALPWTGTITTLPVVQR
jgi:hypothetical protein